MWEDTSQVNFELYLNGFGQIDKYKNVLQVTKMLELQEGEKMGSRMVEIVLLLLLFLSLFSIVMEPYVRD